MNNALAHNNQTSVDESPAGKRGANGFIESIDAIRARARQEIELGAVTDAYKADRDAVVSLLNDALATELVCMLRYKRHYFMAQGLNAEPAAAEFLEHANEEQAHADALAARIVQLGGEPDFAPERLADRSHADYVPCSTLTEMMRENLVAERIAVDTYSQIIRYLGDDDPTTRRLLEVILAIEEEHADEMAGMLGFADTRRQSLS